MTRKRARSSMRFSRNDRLFDLLRCVRLLRTSTTSWMFPDRMRSELSLKRPFQFWWLSMRPSPSSENRLQTSVSSTAGRKPTPSTLPTGTSTVVSFATSRNR